MNEAIARAQKELKEEKSEFKQACHGLFRVVHDYSPLGITIQHAREYTVKAENLDEAVVQYALWHLVNAGWIQWEEGILRSNCDDPARIHSAIQQE